MFPARPSWYLPITQAQAREKQQLRRTSAADMLYFATSLQINMCKKRPPLTAQLVIAKSRVTHTPITM
jgi:hypothetical protein